MEWGREKVAFIVSVAIVTIVRQWGNIASPSGMSHCRVQLGYSTCRCMFAVLWAELGNGDAKYDPSDQGWVS